jgi:hypothetical protein
MKVWCSNKFIGQITGDFDFVTSCESISPRLTGEVFTETAIDSLRLHGATGLRVGEDHAFAKHNAETHVDR